MRIRQLRLENFRAFPHAEVRIPEIGLVLIAGANNAGKSALLSGLDVVAGTFDGVASVRHGGGADPARVTAAFDLDDAERAAALAPVHEGQALSGLGALASVEFVYEQWDDQHLKLREVHGTWPDAGMVPVARMRPDPQPGRQSYVVEVAQAFQQGSRARGTPEVLRKLADTGRNDVDISEDLYSYLAPIGLVAVSQALRSWRSRYYHFRALRTGTQRIQALSSVEQLNPTGDNLASVLLHLATDRRGQFEAARNLIAQVVPGIGALNVRTGQNQLRIVFESTAGDLNLKDLGTGVEQLLMTFVVGLTEAAPFTLLIEEPETNLNPAAQRALLGLLKDWARERLIIAATHSPVMLDWSPGGDRLWLVARDGDASTVEPVSADPLPLLDELGVRLSDILSADRLLVLEGPSDQDVLRIWFPEILLSPRVAVLRGGGGDNARHAGRLAEWLLEADRAGHRRVLYLRDRDELAPELLDRLSKSPNVHVLRRRELENYLLDPEALATVLTTIVNPDTPVLPETISEALGTAAESLRRKIVINRVARRVAPKRRLMDHQTRRRLASEAVDQAAFAEAVAERLMPEAELREQIAAAWQEAEADVAEHAGQALLEIAPGEEVLDILFRQYAGRGYDKREHGPMIAAAMKPPEELSDVLGKLWNDESRATSEPGR